MIPECALRSKTRRKQAGELELGAGITALFAGKVLAHAALWDPCATLLPDQQPRSCLNRACRGVCSF